MTGDHLFSHRVYFSDTDAGGIMYHSKYLDVTEHARTELLREIGIEHSKTLGTENSGYVVASLSITYNTPAHLDDLLEVTTEVTNLKRFSMQLRQTVRREEQIIAIQETKLAHINMSDGRPVTIGEKERAYFSSMMDKSR